MRRRPHLGLFSAALAASLLASATGCRPMEGESPDLADVEQHLSLVVSFLPEGCDAAGLDGDGRGAIVGAAFDCPNRATLRIERFDSGSNDDELQPTPSIMAPGRVAWRDASTNDVVHVRSDDLNVDALMRVAESIEVRP